MAADRHGMPPGSSKEEWRALVKKYTVRATAAFATETGGGEFPLTPRNADIVKRILDEQMHSLAADIEAREASAASWFGYVPQFPSLVENFEWVYFSAFANNEDGSRQVKIGKAGNERQVHARLKAHRTSQGKAEQWYFPGDEVLTEKALHCAFRRFRQIENGGGSEVHNIPAFFWPTITSRAALVTFLRTGEVRQ